MVRSRGSGFTLIELLVVIAIILILAALAVPLLARAASKAREVKCLSNVRQCAQALITYANTNEGMLPVCYNHDSRGWGLWTENTWRERILPFLGGHREMLKCTGRSQWPTEKGAMSIYGVNAYVSEWWSGGPYSQGNDGAPPGRLKVTHIDDIDNTSDTLCVAENKDGDWVTEPLIGASWPNWQADGPAFTYHPQERGAFSFCDGRALAMTKKESHERDLYLWKVKKATDPPRAH